MNLDDVRTELGEALDGAGYVFYPRIAGVAELPAVVLGNPSPMRYPSSAAGGVDVDLVATIVVPSADLVEAGVALDAALSTGDGTVVRRLRINNPPPNAGGKTIRAVQIVEAGNYRLVQIGQGQGLAADLRLTITTYA